MLIKNPISNVKPKTGKLMSIPVHKRSDSISNATSLFIYFSTGYKNQQSDAPSHKVTILSTQIWNHAKLSQTNPIRAAGINSGYLFHKQTNLMRGIRSAFKNSRRLRTRPH